MERVSKQVIVVRKDLNMRKGKMVAQGAHAAIQAILDDALKTPNFKHLTSGGKDGELRMSLRIEGGSALNDWFNGRYTKICVSVDSEEELVAVYEQAKAKGLICSLITDAGLTEFNGMPTKTCVAIGPCWSDEVDDITGKLPLL